MSNLTFLQKAGLGPITDQVPLLKDTEGTNYRSLQLTAVVIVLVPLIQYLWWHRAKYRGFFFSRSEKCGNAESHDPFDFASIVPFEGLPIHQRPNWPRYWKAGQYKITMALRKLDVNNWMTFDDQWAVEHEAKQRYCQLPNKHEIVDYLDGDDDEALLELLELVVEYVTRRYPDMFHRDGDIVVVVPTQERYRVTKPFSQPPMEIIGLLVMDDFYILKQGTRDLYYLRGAFLACPTAWRLDQRIGWPVYQLHDRVPQWKEKLRKSMEKFFVNLKVKAPIQRNNLFVQPVGGLFHHDPFEKHPQATRPEEVYLRTELQSLRRLPRSRAIVFSVRTYLTRLTELQEEPKNLERLWDAVRNYPDDVADYKVKGLWIDVFEAFCKEVLHKNDPEIDAGTRNGVGVAANPVPGTKCPAGFA